jgi:hypothetical protein
MSLEEQHDFSGNKAEITKDSLYQSLITSYLRTLTRKGFTEEPIIASYYFNLTNRNRQKRIFDNQKVTHKPKDALERHKAKLEEREIAAINDRENKHNVLVLFRYAVINILGIRPVDLENILTWDILKKIKLDTYINEAFFVNSHFDFDGGEPYKIKYLLNKAYPTLYAYDDKALIYKICDYFYFRMSEYDSKEEKRRISNAFFSLFEENNVRENLNIVFDFVSAISKLRTMTIEQGYSYFTNPKHNVLFLKRYKLDTVVNSLFDGNILEFYHQWLMSKHYADIFYYNAYKVNLLIDNSL